MDATSLTPSLEAFKRGVIFFPIFASTCQMELSDFNAGKQIFDLASLLRYLSAAVANLPASSSFHLFSFGVCVCVCVCVCACVCLGALMLLHKGLS